MKHRVGIDITRDDVPIRIGLEPARELGVVETHLGHSGSPPAKLETIKQDVDTCLLGLWSLATEFTVQRPGGDLDIEV